MRRALLALLLWAAVAPSTVEAQQGLPERRLGVEWVQGAPRLTFGARDLVNAAVREELESGVNQQIVLTVYAYRERGGRPVAASVLSFRVRFLPWEDMYRIQVQSGDTDRTELVRTFGDMVQRCLSMIDLPVGRADDYSRVRAERIFFAVQVDFNPISRERVERLRRHLARGGGLDDSQMFGTVASMFVNRHIGEADRTLRFRSQSVTVP